MNTILKATGEIFNIGFFAGVIYIGCLLVLGTNSVITAFFGLAALVWFGLGFTVVAGIAIATIIRFFWFALR